ncbi:MAG TPA: acylneuraminate cytidylyltransferase family protein [Solirubrobacteraceae bacterium]|nr:acylneuraminate cytidylyltransferase family protein [Solirubrobacteraceae bacterium]
MLRERSFLAVIPARAGSVRIAGKNLRPLAGAPLIAHTLRAALESRHLDHVVVSTDGDEIAMVAGEYGVDVIMRPAELAGPTARSVDAVLHAIATVDGSFSDVVLLQPTSPLRTARHVDEAIEMYVARAARSLLSVCPTRSLRYLRHVDGDGDARLVAADGPDGQDEETFTLNGAVYINEVASLTPDTVMNENRLAFVMDEMSSVDVDEPRDLAVAELFMGLRQQADVTGRAADAAAVLS